MPGARQRSLGYTGRMLPLALACLLAGILAAPVRLERPATPTALPLVDAAAVLADAHAAVFGSPPTRARLSLAVGQVRLEGLALPGHNLGGLEYVEGRPWVRVDRLTRRTRGGSRRAGTTA